MSTIAKPDTATALPALAGSWLWGWAAIGQLILDLMLASVYLLLPLIAVIGIATAPILLIGMPLLLLALVCAQGLSGFERARLFALTGFAVPAAPPPAGHRSWWRRWLLEGRRWRALLQITLMAFWGFLAGTAIAVLTSLALALALAPAYWAILPAEGLHLPWARLHSRWWMPLIFLLGAVGLVLVPLMARGLILVDVALARWLLGPSRHEQVERLSERVDTLTQTRVATVDSVEVERRRIERDLHDGPQQRLVAIAMDLGMAQERIDRDPAGARALLDKAHAAAKEAIIEMRMVARGIHPPVLTDRGLDAALSALAARSPVSVTVTVKLPARPSPTVEAIAYFCVSEALTNVAKHSRATAAQVRVSTLTGDPGHPGHPDDRGRASDVGALTSDPSTPGATGSLRIEIRDDGIGGADPLRGTGLHGLADRVRAIDGSLTVHSPPGGPTVLTINLPWSRS